MVVSRPLNEFHHIRVGISHILQVSGVNLDLMSRMMAVEVNLASESIVLVLASELYLLKSVQDFSDSLGGLSQHRFYRNANTNVASIFKLLHVVTNFLKYLDNLPIVRVFADGFSYAYFYLLTFLSKALFSQYFLVIENFSFEVRGGVSYCPS